MYELRTATVMGIMGFKWPLPLRDVSVARLRSENLIAIKELVSGVRAYLP